MEATNTNNITWETMTPAPTVDSLAPAPQIGSTVESTFEHLLNDAHYYLSTLLGRTAQLEVKEIEGRLALCEFVPDAVRRPRHWPGAGTILNIDPLLVVPLFDTSPGFADRFRALTTIQQDWIENGGTYMDGDVTECRESYLAMLNELSPLLTAQEAQFFMRWMRSIISRPDQYLKPDRKLTNTQWGIIYVTILVVTFWSVLGILTVLSS